MEEKKSPKYRPSAAFKLGSIAFAFLVMGYQAALFVHRAASLRVSVARDHPDTVYVVDGELAARLLGAGGDVTSGASAGVEGPRASEAAMTDTSQKHPDVTVRRDARHPLPVQHAREASRRVESFRFDPNTVSVADLQRLGFSEKQALSIESYREKGGRFRRKSDFARSYVVSDSVYRRLEPFIDIPKLDINRADSAAFDALPGIGAHFASKMVSFREELGGYACKEQLMDIWNFGQERYDALSDLIVCSAPRDSFRLWSLPVEKLREHPYLRSWAVARAVVLYRDNNPRECWSVEGLAAAGVIDDATAQKLARCAIARP